MGDETLSALLFLNKQFKKIVHKGSRLEKLDKLDKPKDPKPNPAIEKFDHLDKPKDQKPNPQFNKWPFNNFILCKYSTF